MTGRSCCRRIKQAFIGVQNFTAMWNDNVWWKTLEVTLCALRHMTMVGNIGFALLIAVALKQNFFGRDFFRTAFFAGSVLSVSAAAIIAGRVWDPQRGILNYFLVDVFNLPRVQWLGWTSHGAAHAIDHNGLVDVWLSNAGVFDRRC